MATSASPGEEPEEPLTDMQLETELYRALPEARPVGRHKHVVIIKLQNLIYGRTRHWVEIEELWRMLGELYDLEGLDEMAASSSSSLPQTPDPLSPLIRKSKSLSPLSSAGSSPPPTTSSGRKKPRPKGETHPDENTKKTGGTGLTKATKRVKSEKGGKISRSAGVIDHKHFARTFELPAIGLREDDLAEAEIWRGMVYKRARAEREGVEEWGGKGEDEFILTESKGGRDEDGDGDGDGDGDDDRMKEGGEGKNEVGEQDEEEGEDEEDVSKKRKRPYKQYGRKTSQQPVPLSATSKGRRASIQSSVRGKKEREGSSDLSDDEDIKPETSKSKLTGKGKWKAVKGKGKAKEEEDDDDDNEDDEGDEGDEDGEDDTEDEVEDEDEDEEEEEEEEEEAPKKTTKGIPPSRHKRKRESGSTAKGGGGSEEESPVKQDRRRKKR